MPVPDSRAATECRGRILCLRYEGRIHSERVAAIILSPSYAHMLSDSCVYAYICSVLFSVSLMYPDTLFPPLLQCPGRLKCCGKRKPDQISTSVLH